MFNEAIVGNMSMENYSEYKKNIEGLEKQPDYVIRKALDDMQWISYEHLFLLTVMYEKELDEGSLGTFMHLLSLSDNI
ncbi:hypothetical protein D3C72_2081570 [compost metagenome]